MLSDHMLRQMVDAMPMPVFVTNESDHFVYANRAFETLIHTEAFAAKRDAELDAAHAELREARAELARMRETDPVTQALSRRALRAHTEDATDARTTDGHAELALSITVGAAYSDDIDTQLAALITEAEQALRSASPCRNEAVVAACSHSRSHRSRAVAACWRRWRATSVWLPRCCSRSYG